MAKQSSFCFSLSLVSAVVVDGEIHESDLRQSYLEAFKSPSVPKMKGSIVKYWWRSGGVIEILWNEHYFFIGPKHSGHGALTQQLPLHSGIHKWSSNKGRSLALYCRCTLHSANSNLQKYVRNIPNRHLSLCFPVLNKTFSQPYHFPSAVKDWTSSYITGITGRSNILVQRTNWYFK